MRARYGMGERSLSFRCPGEGVLPWPGGGDEADQADEREQTGGVKRSAVDPQAHSVVASGELDTELMHVDQQGLRRLAVDRGAVEIKICTARGEHSTSGRGDLGGEVLRALLYPPNGGLRLARWRQAWPGAARFCLPRILALDNDLPARIETRIGQPVQGSLRSFDLENSLGQADRRRRVR